MLAGGLVLALLAVGIVLLLYYRPTVEYVSAPEQIPGWLTAGRIVGGIIGALAVGGGLLLWAGVR